MGWEMMAVGAGIGLLGLLGGSKSKGATYINIKYPEPDPVEMEIASMQLDMARKLREKVDDPTIMQDIYKLLPETKMSEADRARFTNEYAEISNQATMAAMGQAKQAVGEDLDSLVERGVMSQTQADRQRVANEAGINSMMSILNKRLEASRIGLTRKTWLQDQATDIGTASSIARVDQANKSTLNSAIEAGLAYAQKRGMNTMALQSNIANANLGTWADTSKTKSDFLTSTILVGSKLATSGIQTYQQNQDLQKMIDSGNLTAKDAALIKALRE